MDRFGALAGSYCCGAESACYTATDHPLRVKTREAGTRLVRSAPAQRARVPAEEPVRPQAVVPRAYELREVRHREGRERSNASSPTLAMGSGVNLLVVSAQQRWRNATDRNVGGRQI